jgi:adenylate cyclase
MAEGHRPGKRSRVRSFPQSHALADRAARLSKWLTQDHAVSWATDRQGGFSEADLRLFEEVLPTYSTVVEVKSLRRFAVNVLSTYVGREPSELILKGQIRRGDVRTIKAALMMVDLRDFTVFSDALPPSKVIETLNRYFDSVIPPIKRHGGEVLEFLGDGILAILHENGERSAREACQLAFEAAREGLDGLSALDRDLSISPRHLQAGSRSTMARSHMATLERVIDLISP